MTDWKEAGRFGSYISSLRGKRGFSMEQVSEGLCTEQVLSYYEKGKRRAPKLLQDAILERLGVGAEDYEHYLPCKEYDQWEARQRILYCIVYEKKERARQLLEQYRHTYVKEADEGLSVTDRLERQFYLSMFAQIRCREGADRAEMSSLLEEAVHLTMPGLWSRSLKEMVLSLKELNLILEAEQYREGEEVVWHYQELLGYIEAVGLDGAGMAKIYPKAVYFLCRCLDESGVQGGGIPEEQLLRYCNTAVEYLRDDSRMCYLWELLDMREKLLSRITGRLSGEGQPKKADALKPMRRENEEWKNVLESVYEEYDVPKETSSYCYLYVERGVACINDVVRIRREMFGMSREELCQGICDVKTLKRLENRKAVSHREIVEKLFERLGLSRELTRTELVTEKPEARQLMAKLRVCLNERRTEDAEALLAQIKELVSVGILCNRQALMRSEIIMRKDQGELDAVECYRELRQALELTMPYEAFLKNGEKYLTHEEQSCIQNMMQGMDKKSEEFMTCMNRFEEMYQSFEEKELMETVSGMYELIMRYVGSEWGNRGKYDRSDRFNRIIVMECLRFRRLHSIAGGLYGCWWNYTERKLRGIPTSKVLNGEEELTKCLVLSTLDKQKYYEPFYRKKLEQEKRHEL